MSPQLVPELIDEGARLYIRKGKKEKKVLIISKLQKVHVNNREKLQIIENKVTVHTHK